MLRPIAAILLLAAFAAQTFSKTFLVIGYYSNTSSFARDCINKTRIALNCNGKCVLMKKLMAEEKKEQQNPELKLENKSEIIFFAPGLPEMTVYVAGTDMHFAPVKPGTTLSGHPHAIFHPPALS